MQLPGLESFVKQLGVPSWQEIVEQSRQREEERARLESLPPLYIVHTIHGTRFPFTAKPTWIHENSDFSLSVKKRLGWRAKIEPFVWNGKNDTRARWEAAAEFRAKIEKSLKDFGEAEHFVIAHSHGGNVAFMALQTEFTRRIAGVITLATPFLSAQLRSHKEFLDPVTGLIAGLFAGWAVIFYGVYRGLGWGLWTWAIGAVFGTIGLIGIAAWLIKYMQVRSTRILKMMPTTGLLPEQVAVICVQGDEATAAIAGTRLAGKLSHLLWRTISTPAFEKLTVVLNFWDYLGSRSTVEKLKRAWDRSDSNPSMLFGSDPWRAATLTTTASEAIAEKVRDQLGIFIPQIAPILLAEGLKSNDPTQRFFTLLCMGLYGLPAALALLTVVLGIPFAILSSASLFPCGWTLPLAGPYLNLSAESSPVGSWTVSYFDADAENSLSHTKAYDIWQVQEFIANWIKRRSTIRSQELMTTSEDQAR
jgi:hypothetical protein